jgi:periplasmic protein CpxP/Spy
MSTFASATRLLAVPALLSALALGVPAAASAQATNTVTPAQQSAVPAASATAPAAKTKMRHGGIEQHIADLHQKLKITSDQETQWSQFADVMRQNAAAVEAAVKDRAANAKTMTAIDNLQSYEKISEAHQQGIEKLIPAFQTLYDSMSDAQKKNADAVFRASAQRHAARAKKTS